MIRKIFDEIMKWDTIQNAIIPNRHNTKWTQSAVDTIPNEPSSEIHVQWLIKFLLQLMHIINNKRCVFELTQEIVTSVSIFSNTVRTAWLFRKIDCHHKKELSLLRHEGPIHRTTPRPLFVYILQCLSFFLKISVQQNISS